MTTFFVKTLPVLLMAGTLFASCSRPGNATALSRSNSMVNPVTAEAQHAAGMHRNCPIPLRCSPIETDGNPWADITKKEAAGNAEAVTVEIARRESSKVRRAYSFAFGC